MSTQLIVLCSVAGALLLAVIFYLSFVHESQTNRRALKIAKLTEKIRRYQTYLDCFPEGYLPKDVRRILVEEIIYSLQGQQQIEPSAARFKRLIDEYKLLLEQINNEKASAPKIESIQDIKMAKELQIRLKSLFNSLTHIGKTRKHHTNAINKNLKILKGVYVETAISVHKNAAVKAAKQGKTKLAIHNYNQVIAEYARTDAKQFAGKIKETRALVQQLNSQLQKEQDANKKQIDDQKKAQQEAQKTSHGLDKMNTDGARMRKNSF